MTKATEQELSALHGAVAKTLTKVVEGCTLEHEDGSKEYTAPSAAHVMAAITFLKNNSITADANANDDLAELNKQLAARRKDRKVTLLDIGRAAAELDHDLGGFHEGP